MGQTQYQKCPLPVPGREKETWATLSAGMTSEPRYQTIRSMADYVAEQDASRFVGRTRELELLSAVLGDNPPASIVLIHGPGGIGKSGLLREVRRRASALGFRVRMVDGRTAAGISTEIDQAVADLVGAPLPLLIIDSYERARAIGAHLRDHLLPTMPAATRVIIAGRNPPEPAWLSDGWDSVTTSIELSRLSNADSRLLVERLGIAAGEDTESIVEWAAGEPLALVVGATERSRLSTNTDLADVLFDRLVGNEVDESDHLLLSVASIARAIDGRLIGAVLDGVDGDSAIARLRSLSFSEDLGDRVTLHERIRKAFHARLARDQPVLERELRRRLADHMHDRAREGDARYLVEIGSLFADPALRWGWAADDRGTYRVDRVRPGDEESAAEALGADDLRWWQGVRRWFVDSPESITAVRDTAGRLAGFCILVTPSTVPGWATDDPILGPRLRHAAGQYPDGNVVLWRDAFGFPSEEGSDPSLPLMMAIQGAIISSEHIDSLATYGSIVVGDPTTIGLADAYGAVAEPELRVIDGERTVDGAILHHGHGSFIGAAKAKVYHDLGLPLPLATEGRREAVRSALRDFHDPLALALSPLASGDTPTDRATSVRRLLTDTVEAAFGVTPRQRMERLAIERGYFDPDATHEGAARSLHIGRSTYFRHLTRGIDRITAYLDEAER